MDHNKLENSLRDGNTRRPYLPPEKSVCRPGMRPRPCRAPCKANGPRWPPPPPSLVICASSRWLQQPPPHHPRRQPDGVDPRAFAPPLAAAMQKFLHPHVALGSPPAFRSPALPSSPLTGRPLRRQAVQAAWPKTTSRPRPSLATAASGSPGLSPPGHSGGDSTSLLAGLPCPLITPLPSPAGPFFPSTPSLWSMPFLEIWPTLNSKPCRGTLCHCKPKQESLGGPRVLQDGSLSPINALATLYTLCPLL